MHAQLYELLHLHKIVVVKETNDFTWSSGLKAPVYCDLRKAWSFIELRSALIKAICDNVRENCFDFVMGMATAGIIPAALVAEKLRLPAGYIRKKTKSHGTKQIIEGCVSSKNKVLIIEDTISTGGSVLNAIHSLQTLKIKPQIMAIWTNCPQKVQKTFDQNNCCYKSLLNCPEYLQYLRAKNLISVRTYDVAKSFITNLEKAGQSESR